MEIGATLAQLELFASNPEASASFYAATFGLQVTRDGDAFVCTGPNRRLRLVAGEGGQLSRATFAFHSRELWEAYRLLLEDRRVPAQMEAEGQFSVRDPEGRLIVFRSAMVPDAAAPEPQALPARLQHFAVRSPNPAALVDFYVKQLGFVLSDRVLDAQGELTAAFMRTDSEHHAMAVFRASEMRFDHFSCEAPDWHELRRWADHMAEVGVDLAWGIGRHGPGNDNFLMVRDEDGNMGEVSSDLEVCAADRPAGVWPHRPQTLNRWGVAIMRS